MCYAMGWRLTLLLLLSSGAGLQAFRRPTPKPPAPKPVDPFAGNGGSTGDCGSRTDYNIGRGIYDITGPAAEQGMMGYADLGQKTKGIMMRQWARAFVFHSPCNGKRVVFVSADLGQLFQSIKQGVVNKLKARYGNTYTDQNVLLSATHTHSGPGGYSHYALYNLTTLGYSSQTYNVTVNGIFEAISRAHDSVKAGKIYMNEGELTNAGMNRSYKAYAKNAGSRSVSL